MDAETGKHPPLGVVTRQSTDVLAASDPRVASALRFMWGQVTGEVSVDRAAYHTSPGRYRRDAKPISRSDRAIVHKRLRIFTLAACEWRGMI